MLNAPAQQPVWTTEGNDKRTRVKNMFAGLASRYDLLNSLISLRLHYRWRSVATAKLNLRQGDIVLDLCCGTGSFSRAISKIIGPRGKIIGCDFCLPMLEIAQRSQNPQTHFAMGDALRLPITSNCVNGVTVGWGIRNVVDVDRAHAEIFRVLKPGSRFASVDMAVPANPVVRTVSSRMFLTVVPFLGKLFGKREAYMYLPKSTEKFKSREELAASMKSTGFTHVSWQNLMFGNICIHWGEKP